MTFLIIIGLIALLVISIMCSKKQMALRGFYQRLGLVSNLQLFFTGCFILGGVLGVILLLLSLAAGIFKNPIEIIPSIVVFIISLVAGVLMYINAKKKLPELQKYLLRDCIIIFLGFYFRISFFILVIFINTWFTVNAPEEFMLNDGRIVYKYPMSNEAYDCHGWIIGTLTSDNKNITMY